MAWKTAAPTPAQGSGPTARARAQQVSPADTQGLPAALPQGREAKPDASLRPFCPHAPSPGWRGPGRLTQLLGEDLVEGHLAPVLQVLLHDTADAGRQKAGDRGPGRRQQGALRWASLLPLKVTAEGPGSLGLPPKALSPTAGWPEGGC